MTFSSNSNPSPRSNPDRDQNSLRFGILYDGATLERWQQRCLEQLAELPRVQAALLLVGRSVAQGSTDELDAGQGEDAGNPSRQSLLPGKAPGESHRVPLDPSFAGLPSVALTELKEPARGRLRLDGAVLARIGACSLDFVLSFVEHCPAELLEIPRYGVWHYRFGDWVQDRGGPAGFWEVYERRTISTALLVRLQQDSAAVVILREGHLRTNLLSCARNRRQLLTRFTHWPAQLCTDIRNGVTDRLSGPAVHTTAPPRPWPSRWQLFVYGCRVVARMASEVFSSLFLHDQWNVGIVAQPITNFLRPGPRAPTQWLPATARAELRADPFGVLQRGELTILCEHFSYRDNQGFIVALDPALGAFSKRVTIGPQPPVHLSYPFLLEMPLTDPQLREAFLPGTAAPAAPPPETRPRLFCIPESSEANEVALYEVERFPDRWVKSAVLIAAAAIVDATIFRHGDHWWLSGSEVAPKGANCELHLWYAEAVDGPWRAHPGNPVKIDIRSSRPAGTPFLQDGVLYRPTQDCSETYGGQVILNRVVTLTPTAFREEPAGAVAPDADGPYPDGLHTLSRVGDLTLIDGKRRLFVPAEFRRVLCKKLRAVLRSAVGTR